jgi:hypothetical protein
MPACSIPHSTLPFFIKHFCDSIQEPVGVAHQLERHNLQFYVNVELGNLTMGSAACGGTKDASMPGEFGQVCSYATVIKLVTPSGELLEVTEEEPELLQVVRSSYGLLGIVYEVTFKVKPLKPMAIDHVTYTLDEFVEEFDMLTKRNESMMMYLFPFLDRVSVEFRKHIDTVGPPNRFIWKFRNTVWKTVAPGLGYILTRFIPVKPIRYFLVDRFNQFNQFLLHWFLKDKNTIPTDQIIRYPAKSNWTRYTFSIWAFPEESYTQILRAYFEFCREYYREHGYRCNMLNVAYRISKDNSSLFSYIPRQRCNPRSCFHGGSRLGPLFVCI